MSISFFFMKIQVIVCHSAEFHIPSTNAETLFICFILMKVIKDLFTFVGMLILDNK